MIQKTEIPAKSIWKMLPMLCVLAMIGINSIKSWPFEYVDKLTLILVILSVSLISTIIWMRKEYRNGTLKTGKVILLISMIAVTISIFFFAYFS